MHNMNSKSQSWGMDLMIAVVIFSVGIMVFFIYSINNPSEPGDSLENLIFDGESIANSILSEGYPADWESFNVLKIGVLTNGKINETKLEEFYNISQDNYKKTKGLFNTKYDYYFLLDEKMTVGTGQVEGIGKPGVNPRYIDTKNLIRITRFTVYKDRPVTAYVYIWGG